MIPFWLNIALVIQYAALAILNLAQGNIAKGAYWIGAVILGLSVAFMR